MTLVFLNLLSTHDIKYGDTACVNVNGIQGISLLITTEEELIAQRNVNLHWRENYFDIMSSWYTKAN